MRLHARSIAVMAMTLALAAGPAAAQDCKPEDVFAVIDATGARLREINTEWQPRLRDKMRELAARRGWNEAEAETKCRPVIEDGETQRLDGRAAELLGDIDRLGDDTRSTLPACERLEQARTKSAQLAEVTAQRAAHVIARIDVALKPAATAAPAPAPAPPSLPSEPPPARQAATPSPKAAFPSSWQTNVRDAEPTREALAAMPPPPDPGALGYSPEEIQAAGRGFFGSISAGLAGVIDYAFQRYGRPTGYVLGDEGGAAFVAGLRYGKGQLVTKQQGERQVYWQGPSAGFDFGLAGSQVMFLVYSIDDHEQMFQRFTGVDGSAYLVGGAGITFLKRGKVILAPIRTGIGVRVGANVGYLKFTPSLSLNPF